MSRKIRIGSVALFVTTRIIEGFLNLFLPGPVYSSYPQIWRPPAEMKLWKIPLGGMFFSFFFVFIFSNGLKERACLKEYATDCMSHCWLRYRPASVTMR